MRYQVKWTDKNGEHFGIVNYGEKEKGGKITVQDAILPVDRVVPEKDLVDIETNYGTFDMKSGEWTGQDEYQTYVANERKKAEKLSDSLVGVQVGSLFSIGVGDGYAWYVVTKVGKRSSTVEWRGFCPDRWVAPLLGGGGSVATSRIEPYVRRGQSKLFSRKAV